MSVLLDTYLKERPWLLRVAYRILGSQTEAEDVLQDLYLKLSQHEADAIRDPRAWLIRVVVNTAIDQKRAFYRRKIDYVGSWLPEPFVEPEKDLRAVKDDISMALMVLMERLNPIERAVFVLRESCELPYAEIAAILGMTEAASRKSFQRAEDHLDQGRKRFTADPSVHQTMTMAFLQYWMQGKTEELVKLLKADAVLYSDGGGKATATAKPIPGAAGIAKFLLSLLRAAGPNVQARVEFMPPDKACVIVNGKLETVISLETDGQTISNLYFMRNPEKMEKVVAWLDTHSANR